METGPGKLVGMAEEQSWEATLRRIVDRMVETGVTDLDVRRGDVRLRLRRQSGDPPEGRSRPHGQIEAALSEPGDGSREAHAVLAPLTGVFYASPNPSARAYVEAGEWVEEGAVIGLIETMKVFNEVTADRSGRIVAIQAQQGQLVQTGDVVALIDTTATPDQDVEVAP